MIIAPYPPNIAFRKSRIVCLTVGTQAAIKMRIAIIKNANAKGGILNFPNISRLWLIEL